MMRQKTYSFPYFINRYHLQSQLDLLYSHLIPSPFNTGIATFIRKGTGNCTKIITSPPNRIIEQIYEVHVQTSFKMPLVATHSPPLCICPIKLKPPNSLMISPSRNIFYIHLPDIIIQPNLNNNILALHKQRRTKFTCT